MNVEVTSLVVQRAPSTFDLPALDKTFSTALNIFQHFCFDETSEMWYRLKDKVIKPSPLGVQIREFSNQPNLSARYDFQIREILCQTIYSEEFSQHVYFLSKIFNLLDDKQLNDLLTSLFNRCDPKEPLKLINKLKTLLTLDKIECAIRSELPVFGSAFSDIVSYSRLSKHDLEAKRKQNLQNIRRTAYHYAISALDHFVNLFSLVFHLKNTAIDEGDPASAQMQANMQYTALMQNLSLISGWVIALSLYLASAAMTAAICGFTALCGGAIAYLYYNYLKPCPENVSPFKNLITEVNMGTVPEVAGREKEIEQVINYLCSNDSNTRNHPLLVGASGVGKTQIIQGLAHRISAGNVPPLLQNKKLFVVNTSDLVSGSAWGRFWNFEKMLHIMKGYENEAIFFFDEIHVAFNTEENADLGQKLKTIMDPGPGNLKFCIGATTIKEYEQFMEKDEAFTRRMPRVDVNSMTPMEVQSAVLQQIYKELPNIVVESGVADKLAYLSLTHTEFANVSQPYKSLALLNLGFTQAKTPQVSPEKIALRKAYANREFLIKENAIAFGLSSLPSSVEGQQREKRRLEIEKVIEDLEPKVSEQEKKSDHLKFLIKMRHEMHENSLLDAIRLHDKSPDGEDLSSEELKFFLLQYHYLRLAIFRQIENLKKEFVEAPFFVTNEMISRLIAKEAENIRYRLKSVTPGSQESPKNAPAHALAASEL